jgi:hypothetical protein
MVSKEAEKKVLSAFQTFYSDKNLEDADDTEFLDWIDRQPNPGELREAFFILVFGDKGLK